MCKIIKGYKGFNQDLSCTPWFTKFQYEIGKTYKLGETAELELCRCGFHFCQQLKDVFSYYHNGNVRFCEIEAIGNTINDLDGKSVTNKIKIVKEIFINDFSEKEKLELVKENEWAVGAIKNPRLEAQKLAVKKDGMTLGCIKTQNLEIQKLAVQEKGIAIYYINNPSLEVQKLAVKQTEWAIMNIKNPSKEILDYNKKRWG